MNRMKLRVYIGNYSWRQHHASSNGKYNIIKYNLLASNAWLWYVFYCLASIFDLDHLCFRQTTYDNINGPGGIIYVVILGLAGPLMYLDQISHYRPLDKLYIAYNESLLLLLSITFQYNRIVKYSCDCDFGVYNCSNIVSLVAVPIMHREIIIECRHI